MRRFLSVGCVSVWLYPAVRMVKTPLPDSPAAEEVGRSAKAPVGTGQGASEEPSVLQGFFNKLTNVEGRNDDILNKTPREIRRQEKILKEREEMIVFRDIGTDVDRVILKRDSVQLLKFFYLGKEYAIDVQLERSLRYFKEHAVAELYTSYGMKLYQGLDRVSTPAGSVLFPTVTVGKCSQYFTKPEASEATRTDLYLKPSGVKYDRGDEKTTISPMFFKLQPSIVVIGPIGTSATYEIESMWRDMYVDFIVGGGKPGSSAPASAGPAAADKKATADSAEVSDKGQPSAVKQEPAPTKITSEDVQRIAQKSKEYSLMATIETPIPRLLPSDLSRKPSVDFVTIRDIEAPFRFIHHQVVHRTCRRFPYPLLERTFVGHGVLKSFFQYVLPLRNPRVTYVFLVDHRGRIRWTTTGPPNAEERKWVPGLMQQLVMEQFKEAP